MKELEFKRQEIQVEKAVCTYKSIRILKENELGRIRFFAMPEESGIGSGDTAEDALKDWRETMQRTIQDIDEILEDRP